MLLIFFVRCRGSARQCARSSKVRSVLLCISLRNRWGPGQRSVACEPFSLLLWTFPGLLVMPHFSSFAARSHMLVAPLLFWLLAQNNHPTKRCCWGLLVLSFQLHLLLVSYKLCATLLVLTCLP